MPKINPEPYKEIINWFEQGNHLDLSDDLPFADYLRRLRNVEGLEALARKHLSPPDDLHLAAAMEFALEGLTQHFLISKKYDAETVRYVDTVSEMMRQL